MHRTKLRLGGLLYRHHRQAALTMTDGGERVTYSADTEPREDHHLSVLLLLKHRRSRQRLGSHGTTAALRAFAFVIATIGASESRFAIVRACAHVS